MISKKREDYRRAQSYLAIAPPWEKTISKTIPPQKTINAPAKTDAHSKTPNPWGTPPAHALPGCNCKARGAQVDGKMHPKATIRHLQVLKPLLENNFGDLHCESTWLLFTRIRGFELLIN